MTEFNEREMEKKIKRMIKDLRITLRSLKAGRKLIDKINDRAYTQINQEYKI